MTTVAERVPGASARARSAPTASAVLRHHSRSFYLASRLLGRRHAARAARLYAFCRHVDDLADSAASRGHAASELAALRNALETGQADGGAADDLLALAADTGMPLAPALALIDGVGSDLGSVMFADESELLGYAYRVAGTVGVMMCYVLDVRDPAALPHAIDLGIAMQLTNIARDVGEDARAGRRYLPGSWVAGATAAEIAAPDAALQPVLRGAIARTLALAEPYYASGRAGFGYLPPRARPAIRVAAAVYRGIGVRIASEGYASWRQRAVVGRWAKLGHAAHALLRPGAWRRSAAAHDPALHCMLPDDCGVDRRGAP